MQKDLKKLLRGFWDFAYKRMDGQEYERNVEQSQINFNLIFS